MATGMSIASATTDNSRLDDIVLATQQTVSLMQMLLAQFLEGPGNPDFDPISDLAPANTSVLDS